MCEEREGVSGCWFLGRRREVTCVYLWEDDDRERERYMRRSVGERRYDDEREEEADEEDAWREMLVYTRELLRDGNRRLREVVSKYAAFREQRAREDDEDEEGGGGGNNSQPLERDLSVVYFESKKQRLEAHITSLERSRAAIEDAMQYALQEDTNTDEFKRLLRRVSYYCSLTQHQALIMMDSDDEEYEDDNRPDVQLQEDDDMPMRENVASPRRGIFPALTSRLTRPRIAVQQHSV